jgi:hypothetical protein
MELFMMAGDKDFTKRWCFDVPVISSMLFVGTVL